MNTPHGVAGIDPHKHTATVAVVDVLGATSPAGPGLRNRLGQVGRPPR